MTDPISNERLARELWKKHGGAQHGPRTETLYMPEANFAGFIADLLQSRRQSPAGVEVRPLEWVDADEGMCTKWRAAALGGHYELVDFGKDDPGFAVNFHWGRPLSFWFIQGEPDEWGPTGPKMFPTLEDAKAAAQADYERRVLSCLVSHKPASGDTQDVLPSTDEVQEPAGVEPVAWQCFDCIMEQWSVIDDAELAAARSRRDGEWIVRPLYASPPKAVTITDEMVERAAQELLAYAEFSSIPWRNHDGALAASRASLSAALSSEAHNG